MRRRRQGLKDFIQKYWGNPDAKEKAVALAEAEERETGWFASKTLRERVKAIAFAELGQAEVPGAKAHNKRIQEYLAASGFKPGEPDETSWCAAFVNWSLEQAGIKGTGSGLARSFQKWGTAITNGSEQTGDIVVFWRESPKSWKGHVAFFVRRVGSHVEVLGGNQSNKVSLAKYPASQILSIRKLA